MQISITYDMNLFSALSVQSTTKMSCEASLMIKKDNESSRVCEFGYFIENSDSGLFELKPFFPELVLPNSLLTILC